MPEPTSPNPAPEPQHPSIFKNWLSFAGGVLMASSLFAFLLLFFLDIVSHSSNPYLGILTFLIAPAFLFAGLVLFCFGAWRWRRILGRANGGPVPIRIDLSAAADRRKMALFVPAAAGFLLLTAMGSYHTYHFTESVQFCGETCHGVMKPELTTYLHSPHARVACAECHIGSGATWYVRSKLWELTRSTPPWPISIPPQFPLP